MSDEVKKVSDIAGFLKESNKAQEYVEAAEAALDRATTPGEIMRIQRMLRQKLRVLSQMEFLKDRY